MSSKSSGNSAPTRSAKSCLHESFTDIAENLSTGKSKFKQKDETASITSGKREGIARNTPAAHSSSTRTDNLAKSPSEMPNRKITETPVKSLERKRTRNPTRKHTTEPTVKPMKSSNGEAKSPPVRVFHPLSALKNPDAHELQLPQVYIDAFKESSSKVRNVSQMLFHHELEDGTIAQPLPSDHLYPISTPSPMGSFGPIRPSYPVFQNGYSLCPLPPYESHVSCLPHAAARGFSPYQPGFPLYQNLSPEPKHCQFGPFVSPPAHPSSFGSLANYSPTSAVPGSLHEQDKLGYSPGQLVNVLETQDSVVRAPHILKEGILPMVFCHRDIYIHNSMINDQRRTPMQLASDTTQASVLYVHRETADLSDSAMYAPPIPAVRELETGEPLRNCGSQLSWPHEPTSHCDPDRLDPWVSLALMDSLPGGSGTGGIWLSDSGEPISAADAIRGGIPLDGPDGRSLISLVERIGELPARAAPPASTEPAADDSTLAGAPTSIVWARSAGSGGNPLDKGSGNKTNQSVKTFRKRNSGKATESKVYVRKESRRKRNEGKNKASKKTFGARSKVTEPANKTTTAKAAIRKFQRENAQTSKPSRGEATASRTTQRTLVQKKSLQRVKPGEERASTHIMTASPKVATGNTVSPKTSKNEKGTVESRQQRASKGGGDRASARNVLNIAAMKVPKHGPKKYTPKKCLNPLCKESHSIGQCEMTGPEEARRLTSEHFSVLKGYREKKRARSRKQKNPPG